MGRLNGRVALITGAARGMGRAHAARLAQDGADVIAIDICAQIETVPYPMATTDDLAETVEIVKMADRRAVSAVADIRDQQALSAAVADAVAELGRLDIVVANAGINSFGLVDDMPEQVWQDTIDTNLTGAWHTVRAALPHLRDSGGGGSIVLISSVAGLRGIDHAAHYVSAKHGLVGLMRALAIELARDMIRVNSVHPGMIATEMIMNEPTFARFRPELDAPTVDDVRSLYSRMNLLPIDWLEPEDVSSVVAFLASDEARYLTGMALPVDAGAMVK